MFLYQVILIFCLIFASCLGQQGYSWRSSKLGVPSDAVPGGYDGQKLPLLIGRAKHDSVWVIGKVSTYHNTAYIPYGGKEIRKSEWDYLVADSYSWIRSYDGFVPKNAVSNDYGGSDYVGRQYVNNALTPGKVSPVRKIIYLPYDGREHKSDKYEVLVVPSCDCGSSEWSSARLQNNLKL